MKPICALLAMTISLLLMPVARGSVLYVNLNSSSPTPPYTNWPTAATTIQDAVDAATNGDLILVTNGIYATGGHVLSTLTNRVAILRPMTVQSVNGPEVTIIQGYPIIGSNAVRCVWLTNNVLLSGFTLTNGATLGSTAFDPKNTQVGGGAYCINSPAVLSNCVVCGNNAFFWGGGAVYGTLIRCRVYGNTAATGGGVYFCRLNNCLLYSNTATNSGGAAVRGTLNNCTVVGNSADTGGGIDGSSDGIYNNCIIYNNSAASDPNYNGISGFSFALNNCCTVPLPTNGSGNITNDPALVNPAAADFHLQPVSRCINAGTNTATGGNIDLDTNPRISGGIVDIGAFEFQAQVTNTFNAWLQAHGLPTNGSLDNVDSDGDGAKNWQEWLADTDPAIASSVLRLVSVSNGVGGITVTWQSVTSRIYSLQRSVNASGPPTFTVIGTNIPGQAGTTSFFDTNPVGSGPVFYRVGVQ
jgi:hypothetical protein